MSTADSLEWVLHSEQFEVAMGLDVDLFEAPEPVLDEDGLLDCALIPLRDLVMYPRMITPLFIGRQRSIAAADAAAHEGHHVILTAQRDGEIQVPGPGDLYRVGTLVVLGRTLRMPDGMLNALAQGRRRVQIQEITQWGTLYSRPGPAALRREGRFRGRRSADAHGHLAL